MLMNNVDVHPAIFKALAVLVQHYAPSTKVGLHPALVRALAMLGSGWITLQHYTPSTKVDVHPAIVRALVALGSGWITLQHYTLMTKVNVHPAIFRTLAVLEQRRSTLHDHTLVPVHTGSCIWSNISHLLAQYCHRSSHQEHTWCKNTSRFGHKDPSVYEFTMSSTYRKI